MAATPSPLRIVSLLPSATEIVCALGLEAALVGRSHECDWPPTVSDLPVVTQAIVPIGLSSGETDRLVRERLARGEGLYTLDADLLRRLQPTLIITQALCEVCAVALPEVLRVSRALPTAPPVLCLEPAGIADILDDIARVADAAGVPDRAAPVIAGLQQRLTDLRAVTQRAFRMPRVALMEWLDPPFVAGHWGPEMIAAAGGQDLFGSAGEKSAQIPWEALNDAAPEVIVIAPCGYDVERARADLRTALLPAWWDDLPAVRSGDVYVMDSNGYVSRPGPRVVEGTEILARLLHPERFVDGMAVCRDLAVYQRHREVMR